MKLSTIQTCRLGDERSADPRRLLENVRSLRYSTRESEGTKRFQEGSSSAEFSSFISPVPEEVFGELYAWLGGLSNSRKRTRYNSHVPVDASERGQIKRWLSHCDGILISFLISYPHGRIRRVSDRPERYTDHDAWAEHLKAEDEELTAYSKPPELGKSNGAAEKKAKFDTAGQPIQCGRVTGGIRFYNATAALARCTSGDSLAMKTILSNDESKSIVSILETGHPSMPTYEPKSLPRINRVTNDSSKQVAKQTEGNKHILSASSDVTLKGTEEVKPDFGMPTTSKSKFVENMEPVSSVSMIVLPKDTLGIDDLANEVDAPGQTQASLERSDAAEYEPITTVQEVEISRPRHLEELQASGELQPLESKRLESEPLKSNPLESERLETQPQDLQAFEESQPRNTEHLDSHLSGKSQPLESELLEAEPLEESLKEGPLGECESSMVPKPCREPQHLDDSEVLEDSEPCEGFKGLESLGPCEESECLQESECLEQSVLHEEFKPLEYSRLEESQSLKSSEPYEDSTILERSGPCEASDSLELDPFEEFKPLGDFKLEESQACKESEHSEYSERLEGVKSAADDCEEEQDWEVIGNTTETIDWALVHGL